MRCVLVPCLPLRQLRASIPTTTHPLIPATQQSVLFFFGRDIKKIETQI